MTDQKRVLATVVGLAVSAAVGVGVASAVIDGPSAPSSVERPAALSIAPGTDRIAASAVGPGGRQWGLRLSESKADETCVEVGRLENGKLGVGASSDFKERAPAVGDGCGPSIATTSLFVHLGASTYGDVVAIHGVAAPEVSTISVTHNGRKIDLPLQGADRAFLGVFDAAGPEETPTTVVLKDGFTFTRTFEPGAPPQPTRR